MDRFQRITAKEKHFYDSITLQSGLINKNKIPPKAVSSHFESFPEYLHRNQSRIYQNSKFSPASVDSWTGEQNIISRLTGQKRFGILSLVILNYADFQQIGIDNKMRNCAFLGSRWRNKIKEEVDWKGSIWSRDVSSFFLSLARVVLPLSFQHHC